jgi:hypothetical protein
MFRQEHPAFFERLRRDGKVWVELEDAERMAGGTADLPPELAQLVESDPGLLDAIASVSQTRKGFDFPPPPTEAQLAVFTEAMVLMPLSPRSPAESAPLTDTSSTTSPVL